MIPIEHFLFPVDLSESSRRVAPYVHAMATRFQSEVILLHVMEIPAIVYAPPEAVSAFAAVETEEQIRTTRKGLFDSFLVDEFRSLRVKREFVEGAPTFEITACAEREKVDLIMLATHGYGPFQRLLLGSVAARVLQEAECPVWTAAHSDTVLSHDPTRLQRILCAVDTEEKDASVIKWTASFAAGLAIEVRLVHIVETTSEDESKREELFKAGRQRIEDLQAEAGTKFEIDVRGGRTPQALHDEAQDLNADLLVIGRGRHKLARLRSTDYEIIREASVPVISV